MNLTSEVKEIANKLGRREQDSQDYTTYENPSYRPYEDEIRILKDKLLISETRLAKLQEFNSSIFRKLNTAEIELKVIYLLLRMYE